MQRSSIDLVPAFIPDGRLCLSVSLCVRQRSNQVREKIFVTDDLPAKQTIIEVSLPDSEIIRPTKILCQ